MTPTDNDLLISTPDIGKEVSFAPALKNEAATLKRAAREGMYYPMLAIKHLNALSTGLSGKRNVFIPNINDFKTNSLQQVVVYVPGIEATVERRPNDSLVVTQLKLSDEYTSIERGSQVKPGVYQVRKERGKVKLTYKVNGRITPKDDRNVVVADTQHGSPEEAATSAAEKLSDMFSSDAALKCNFDLFYSPVGSRLGGMRNYNPNIITEGHAFAGLLADSVEKSKKQAGVVWASELGGSVVLTQALQTLARKGPVIENRMFEGQNHIVKMYMPTTDPTPTLAATTQLGMLADKNLAKGNGNYKASISSMMTNASRAADKSDHYSWNDYGKDMSNGTMVAAGAVGALALGTSAVISSPAVVTVGAVASTIGAAQVGYNALKSYFKRG